MLRITAFLFAALLVGFLIATYRSSINVPDNAVGVLYKRFDGGTVLSETYPSGFHVVLPWNHMTLYRTGPQTVNHEVQVLDAEGQSVLINLDITYQPVFSKIAVLHQKIGPDYVDKVVLPEVAAVVRKYMANYTIQAIDGQYDELFAEVMESVRQRDESDSIEIKAVTIRAS